MNYKKLAIVIVVLLVIIGTLFIIWKNNFQDLSSKYPEIIEELERLYGKDNNFKVIGIKGDEIDERDYKDYRSYEVVGDEIRTTEWRGKYYKDAYLLISTDYLEKPFYVKNKFSSLSFDFRDACNKEGKELLQKQVD